MGSIYLDGRHGYPSLLEVVASTGVPTTGYSGWETRSRGSGGYDAAPMAVIVHHTASPARSTPGQQFANDASYCAVGHQDAPVANMVLGPEGQVSVHAAGASNHAGDGGPWSTSRGTIPGAGANSRTIGIEASNDGQGQLWSTAQQDAYVAIVAALCSAYGFDPGRRGPTSSDVIAHMEWAGPNPPTPGRKCDPAGPSRWSGPSGGCNARNYWRMDEFRADVANFVPGGPPLEEDDMAGYLYQDPRYSNVFLCGQGPATPVPTAVLQALQPKLGPPLKEAHDQTLAAICEQCWGMTVDEARSARMLV
jgi:hypothetical protein